MREHVATRLPAYLVPQRWVPLDTMPLNANGKVDRSALPRPEEPVYTGSTEPSTAAEGHVLAAWIATFARSDFGVTDNFFELGGDSLHALQVLATLRDQAGLSGEASDGLRLLFQNPTVAGFAEALTERGAL